MEANGVSRLRDAFTNGSAVIVAGTGVASALSGNAPAATWIGLIESGVAEIEHFTGTSPQAHAVRTVLALATAGESDYLLMAATMVTKALKTIGDHAYTRWLADAIGALKVEDGTVAQALAALRAVILTTNYDTLIEQALGRGTACWSDPSSLRSAIMDKNSAAVGHLHGVWSVPDSVILTTEDYQRLRLAESTQALQKAVTSLKTILYVGFGSGLEDPNLGELIRWSSNTFPTGAVHHYRLCRDDEINQLRTESGNTDIEVLSYGASYADLPDFLRQLAPTEPALLSAAGLIRDVTTEAQRNLERSLIDESIIAETSGSDRSLEEVIVGPQLLKVPYPQYAKAIRSRNRTDEAASHPQPAEELACESELIVVCGPDESGLTTTIKLMALAAARCLGAVAPLYVNFRQCQRGPRSLQTQIAAAARLAGLTTDHDVPSHPYVLALDDLNPGVTKVAPAVIEALPPDGCMSVIIGCKEGFENDTVERLKATGLNPVVRYLRAMTRDDVTAMAIALSPSAWRPLAERAITVLRTENLPNTPLSVGLLLSVLARGALLSQSATQTAILDEYVSNLLGRGNPHEDARYGADQKTREALLEAFAEYLVVHQVAGVSEGEAVAVLGEAIKRFDWTESAADQLRSLLDRHVLRRVGDHIVFSRHSYLYLFAAKRSTASATFAHFVRQRPLYYSSVIRDHAALVRRDAELLGEISHLLLERLPLGPAPVSAFDAFDRPDGYRHFDTDESQLSTTHSDVAAYDGGLLDPPILLGEQQPPFPSDDPSEMAYSVKVLRSAELVSAVLRDSDQIEDLALKRSVLVSCLDAWGHVVKALESDSAFSEFSKDFARSLWDSGFLGRDEDHREEAVEQFSRLLPTLLLVGGVAGSLASRKLLATFQHEMNEGALATDQAVEAGALVFAYVVREPGWPSQIRALLTTCGQSWLIRRFMLALWIDDFEKDRAAPADQPDLLELCVHIRTSAEEFTSAGERTRFADGFRERLRGRRNRARARTALSRSATRLEDPKRIATHPTA